MERFSSHFYKIIALLAPIILLPFALADESIPIGEDYYGNDIDAAITEAKQSKRKGNYDNRYWYNRTTSESFALPKMQADALEKERLEGALGVTQAGEQNDPDQKSVENEQAIASQQDNVNTQKNTVQQSSRFQPINTPSIIIRQLPSATSHQHAQGKITTQGVMSVGTITSTARP